MTHFRTQKPQWVCRCGHSESAHDAGACWHPPNSDQYPAVRCTCDGYEEVADDNE